jgi:hypothetical protein
MIVKGRIGWLMLWVMCAAVCVTGIGLAADTQPPPAAPKREHFAFASDIDYLDGPRLEALGSGKGSLPTNDPDGNLYLVYKYSTCRIRVVRADGRVETIAGDDRWPGSVKLDEGPAAYFPNRFASPQAGDYSKPGAIITVSGYPLKGEDEGCIYFYWPGSPPYRIFRNEEKDDRWWFERMGKPGGAKPPAAAKATAKIEETDLTDARIGNGYIAWNGNVYSFDAEKGEMTCLFTLDSYAAKVQELAGRRGRRVGVPEHIERTDDGTFYLSYFWKTYPAGHVFKVSADGTALEHVVADISHLIKGSGIGANRDGLGLKTTWHCGPADITATGNVVFLHSIDSVAVRRLAGGRMSTLCYDGKWRETPKGRRGNTAGTTPVMGKHHQPGRYGVGYIYITYPGEENGSDNRVYRFGPVDLAKPTVGPVANEAKIDEILKRMQEKKEQEKKK